MMVIAKKRLPMKMILLAAFLVTARLSFAQTAPSRSEIERRVATLPEERRTYERFWSWVSAQPANERGTGEGDQYQQDALLRKYKSWLVETGSSSSAAGKEIAT